MLIFVYIFWQGFFNICSRSVRKIPSQNIHKRKTRNNKFIKPSQEGRWFSQFQTKQYKSSTLSLWINRVKMRSAPQNSEWENVLIKASASPFRGNCSCGIQQVVPSGRARWSHLARSGSQSQRRIWFILLAHGVSHITMAGIAQEDRPIRYPHLHLYAIRILQI